MAAFLQHQAHSNRGYALHPSVHIICGIRVIMVLTFLLVNATPVTVTAFLAPTGKECSPLYHHLRRQNAVSQTEVSMSMSPRYMGSSVRKKLTRLHAAAPEDDPPPPSMERNLGIMVLFSVPLAWGTFEPAVRYVYTIEPTVPGFVFSVGYYFVAAVTLSALAGLSMLRNQDSDDNEKAPSLPIRGGIELGIYLFLGNGLQILGLKTVPSDRAAFLLQLTTIFVPLVQAAFARDIFAVPIRTWGACLIALTGVAVMGLDGQGDLMAGSAIDTLVSSFSSLTQGDFLIMLAAFAYTFHCIRLGRYAKETSAIKLASCKATTETVLSLALVLGLVAYAGSAADPSGGILSYAAEEGKDISNFVTFMSERISSGSVSQSMLRPAIGAVLWTGWVTCAYTIYAQSFGQSRVNPTDANLIYTVQPIFTALFAWGLLGETLGPAGYLGGALIGTAVYLVAVSEESDEETHDDEISGPSEGTLDEGEILVDLKSSS